MLENEEEFETVTIEEAEGNVCYLCAEPLLREGYEEAVVVHVPRGRNRDGAVVSLDVDPEALVRVVSPKALKAGQELFKNDAVSDIVVDGDSDDGGNDDGERALTEIRERAETIEDPRRRD